MKTVRLVTFDIRGTLLTFYRSVGEIYADAAKQFGFKLDPQTITSNFNKQFLYMSLHHPNFGLCSGLGWQNWWKSVVVDSLDLTSKNYPSGCHHQCLENLSNYLIERFATKDEWKSVEGSVDVLSYLRSKNVHLGVISNFDPRLHKILKEKDLQHYFTFVVTSYEAGFLKPDINIFKYAEKLYSNAGYEIHKCSIVHIGDSFELDYCGARNAGWNALLLNPKNDNIIHESDVITLKSLTEIKDKLTMLF